VRSRVCTSDDPSAIWIQMRACVFTAAYPLAVGVLMRSSMCASTDPCSVGISVRTSVGASAYPGAVRVPVRARVRATTDPGAVGILMGTSVAAVMRVTVLVHHSLASTRPIRGSF
jgi:hypothetical protein